MTDRMTAFALVAVAALVAVPASAQIPGASSLLKGIPNVPSISPGNAPECLATA
jgi:hypothetical protein